MTDLGILAAWLLFSGTHAPLSVAAGALCAIASVLAVAGTVGLFRFPDAYTRLQASPLAGTAAVFSLFLAGVGTVASFLKLSRIFLPGTTRPPVSGKGLASTIRNRRRGFAGLVIAFSLGLAALSLYLAGWGWRDVSAGDSPIPLKDSSPLTHGGPETKLQSINMV